MSKYERRQWFERLCELREAYHRDEHISVMSIAGAIAHGEKLLAAEGMPENVIAGTIEAQSKTI